MRVAKGSPILEGCVAMNSQWLPPAIIKNKTYASSQNYARLMPSRGRQSLEEKKLCCTNLKSCSDASGRHQAI